MLMHLLITGIAGQIGTRLAQMLDGQGIPFRGLDMADPGFPCEWLRCDLTRPLRDPALAAFLAPVTHVVHLASVMSVAKDIAAEFQEHFDVNVVGLLNLLEALPAGVEHFAFASSMTVYGTPEKMPVDESHPTRPDNLYALGKLATERYLRLYSAGAGLPVAVLRYSSVYGPGRITHRAVPNMIERALDGQAPVINGTGATVRDYVYIDDVVEATIAACRKRASGVFNVGSGLGTSVRELAEAILAEAAPALSPEFRADRPDGYSLRYDVRKMRDELGTSPGWTLGEGIRQCVAWHRDRRGAGQGDPR